MRLIPVTEIPEPERRHCHPLQDIIKGFAESEDDIVRVGFNEYDYKSPKSCYECFWAAAKKSGYRIRTVKRGNNIYLAKY